MPNSSEAHQIGIGNFYPALLRILDRKAAASARKLHGKSQYTAACVNCEFSSWIMCVSLSVLYCLTALLLTRCMDVEQNPGTCDGNCRAFMQAAEETIDTRFMQILHCVHQQSVTLSRRMDESFHRLGQALKRIEKDVIRLKNEAQEDRMDIKELSRDMDKTHSRLDRLEKEMEHQETASRLKNLKFIGIFEPTPGDNRADVDELVATLNYFSSSRTWRHSDIESAHRIGQVHKTSRHRLRQLIVTFSHGDDKLSILRDRQSPPGRYQTERHQGSSGPDAETKGPTATLRGAM